MMLRIPGSKQKQSALHEVDMVSRRKWGINRRKKAEPKEKKRGGKMTTRAVWLLRGSPFHFLATTSTPLSFPHPLLSFPHPLFFSLIPPLFLSFIPLSHPIFLSLIPSGSPSSPLFIPHPLFFSLIHSFSPSSPSFSPSSPLFLPHPLLSLFYPLFLSLIFFLSFFPSFFPSPLLWTSSPLPFLFIDFFFFHSVLSLLREARKQEHLKSSILLLESHMLFIISALCGLKILRFLLKAYPDWFITSFIVF